MSPEGTIVPGELKDISLSLNSGAKLLSAIAPKTKVGKAEFHFISRNIDVNKEKERLSPEYGDWLVSKVIPTVQFIFVWNLV